MKGGMGGNNGRKEEDGGGTKKEVKGDGKGLAGICEIYLYLVKTCKKRREIIYIHTYIHTTYNAYIYILNAEYFKQNIFLHI